MNNKFTVGRIILILLMLPFLNAFLCPSNDPDEKKSPVIILTIEPGSTATVDALVMLDAGGSYSREGESIWDWLWEFTSQPPGEWNHFDDDYWDSFTQFVPDRPGYYGIKLTIRDDKDLSADTTFVITAVQGTPPVAVVGNDIYADLGSEITLDGSASYDPNDAGLNYSWSFISLPDNSSAYIIQEDLPETSFFLDEHGTYLAELTVSNGILTDSAILQVDSNPPVIDSIFPTSGTGDDEVYIYGRNFADDYYEVDVWFADGEAAWINYIDYNQIVVRVPTEAQTGPITVQIDETGATVVSEVFTMLTGWYNTTPTGYEEYVYRDVFINNIGVGVTVGSNGIILGTDDSGNSWFEHMSPTSNQLNAVCGFSSKWWAVGSFSTVVRNITGTWENVPHYFGGTLQSVYVDDSEVWITAVDSVYYSPDNGATWVGFDPSPDNFLQFQPAIGQDGLGRTYLLASQNGGRIYRKEAESDQWSQVHTTPEFLFDLKITNFSGAAVGGAGTLCTTQDYGETWVDRDPLPGFPDCQAISFFGNNAIVVDYNGGIHRTTNLFDPPAEWTGEESGIYLELNAVKVINASDAVAVGGSGGQGIILRRQ